MNLEYFLTLTVTGLAKGCTYALIALGYSMVYGIIELINFAHSEIYMLGAFIAIITAIALTSFGLPLPALFAIAIFVAFIWCAATGYTVEKIAYRPLRQSSRLAPLISAIGMATFLQNYVALAQGTSPIPIPWSIPEINSDILYKYGIDSTKLTIIITSIVVMIGLSLFIKYTRTGKAMRATAQNQKMAQLLGINVDRIISYTFIIGSGLAAIGGLLVATDTGQGQFHMGFMAGMKAFTAAVLGGIGSIPGAMIGGIVLALCESFGGEFFGGEYEETIAFALLILILIFRPTGILGKAKVQKV